MFHIASPELINGAATRRTEIPHMNFSILHKQWTNHLCCLCLLYFFFCCDWKSDNVICTSTAYTPALLNTPSSSSCADVGEAGLATPADDEVPLVWVDNPHLNENDSILRRPGSLIFCVPNSWFRALVCVRTTAMPMRSKDVWFMLHAFNNIVLRKVFDLL